MNTGRSMASELSEELVTFLQVLQEDDALQTWFLGLTKLSPNNRLIEIGKLVLRMKTGGEDPALTKAMELLMNSTVFDGVMKTLQELSAKN